MKDIDIAKQVMVNVSRFEKQRSKRIIVSSLLVFVVGVVIVLLGLMVAGVRLREQDTASLLSLFTQDKEVIALFWRDTIDTVIEELPIFPLSLSIVVIVSILIGIILYGKRFKTSIERLKKLTSMKKFQQTSSKSLVGMAILLGIGIAVVLVIGLVLVGFISKSEMPATSTSTGISQTGSPSGEQQAGVPSPTIMETTSSPVSSGLSLTVSAPENNSIVAKSSVVVQGTTSPKAEVFINDKELNADSKGNFSTTISLDEGENIISVSTNDVDGNFATQELTITYQIPE